MDYLYDHKDLLENVDLGGRTVNEYLEDMRHTSQWGGNPELFAAANIYDMQNGQPDFRNKSPDSLN